MKKLNKFIPLILLTFICVFFLLFILLEKDPGSPPSALIDKQLPDFSTVSLYDENLKLYIKEGLNWMHKKYGFKSKWSMQMFVKTFYDKFFENNKKLIEYKL